MVMVRASYSKKYIFISCRTFFEIKTSDRICTLSDVFTNDKIKNNIFAVPCFESTIRMRFEVNIFAKENPHWLANHDSSGTTQRGDESYRRVYAKVIEA